MKENGFFSKGPTQEAAASRDICAHPACQCRKVGDPLSCQARLC